MTEPLLDAGALEGVRVLELGTAIVGPYCAQNLADLGAEVVKIEPPGGDPVRLLAGFAPNESKLFHTLNRGKRSVVLDLRGEAGREALRRLVPGFDVFVINTRPGVPERLGVDYETLRGLREDLIYVEHTSYGTRGPDARRPGGDVVIQAYSGLMAAESKIDESGAPQRMSSTVLSDYAGGIAGAMGVCAALYRRERTGRGQYISAPLVATAVSFLSYYVSRLPAVDAVTSDPMLERVRAVREGGGGYREVLEARGLQVLTQNAAGLLYTNGYSVRDGAIVLGAVSPENRDQIRAALGIEDDPTADPDFNALDPDNWPVIEAVRERIRSVMRERTMDEWMEALDAAGAPASRVNLPEEVADEPQLEALGLLLDLEHELTGPERMVGALVEMSESATGARRAAPTLGRDTVEVLAEAGFSAAEIEALTA